MAEYEKRCTEVLLKEMEERKQDPFTQEPKLSLYFLSDFLDFLKIQMKKAQKTKII